MNQPAEPTRSAGRSPLLRHWALLLVTAGVLAVGLAARAWMHRNFIIVDDNDVPMLGVADAALGATIGCALLVVLIAHLLLDRERARIERELNEARSALRAIDRIPRWPPTLPPTRRLRHRSQRRSSGLSVWTITYGPQGMVVAPMPPLCRRRASIRFPEIRTARR